MGTPVTDFAGLGYDKAEEFAHIRSDKKTDYRSRQTLLPEGQLEVDMVGLFNEMAWAKYVGTEIRMYPPEVGDGGGSDLTVGPYEMATRGTTSHKKDKNFLSPKLGINADVISLGEVWHDRKKRQCKVRLIGWLWQGEWLFHASSARPRVLVLNGPLTYMCLASNMHPPQELKELAFGRETLF